MGSLGVARACHGVGGDFSFISCKKCVYMRVCV